jgi:hypothetical protein
MLNTTTTGEGNYTFATVQPGSYDLSAGMTGFTASVARNVPVEVQKTSRVDFSLKTGSTPAVCADTGGSE